jgi:hypothetical protein
VLGTFGSVEAGSEGPGVQLCRIHDYVAEYDGSLLVLLFVPYHLFV